MLTTYSDDNGELVVRALGTQPVCSVSSVSDTELARVDESANDLHADPEVRDFDEVDHARRSTSPDQHHHAYGELTENSSRMRWLVPSGIYSSSQRGVKFNERRKIRRQRSRDDYYFDSPSGSSMLLPAAADCRA